MNRRQQGDLGEVSAMEWLTGKGATVLIPFGNSPHFDLVAEMDDRLLRIQVKTSTQEVQTPDGHLRNVVAVRTCGGNRSWSGVVKRLDPSRFDFLFVLTARGRRWFIPSAALDAQSAMNLGGPKYAEYEIERGQPIRDSVFGSKAPIELVPEPGGVPKRSNGRGCKPRGLVPSQVRILPPPLASRQPLKPTRYERKPGPERAGRDQPETAHDDSAARLLRRGLREWQQGTRAERWPRAPRCRANRTAGLGAPERGEAEIRGFRLASATRPDSSVGRAPPW